MITLKQHMLLENANVDIGNCLVEFVTGSIPNGYNRMVDIISEVFPKVERAAFHDAIDTAIGQLYKRGKITIKKYLERDPITVQTRQRYYELAAKRNITNLDLVQRIIVSMILKVGMKVL